MGSAVVLAINAGSTSLKFALHASAPPSECLLRGQYALEGHRTRLSITRVGDPIPGVPDDGEGPDRLGDAIVHLLEWLDPALATSGLELLAAGHRIVHGGRQFVAPARIDQAVLGELERLAPLAPLHQPAGLAAVRALAGARPDLPQVACFDTAFHAGHPAEERLYGLPRNLAERGFVRFGFHGLACESVMASLAEESPERATGRVLVAHLGGGASLTGIVSGRSVRNTMGWSALDGLVMATRAGSLDPALVLALVQEFGNVAAVEHLLYRESGLRGLAGTGDLRELLARDDPEARLAIDVYVRRIVLEAGATIAAMGGIDTLVFSGGIGSNSPAIRSRVCERLGWIGVAIDEGATQGHAVRLEAASSRVAVRRFVVDEEAVIARAAARLITARG